VRRVQAGRLPIRQFALLADAAGLMHGVTTRAGGVSPAPFDTLNLSLSTGDRPEHVDENRSRLAAAVGTTYDWLASCHQVHGARAVQVDDQPLAVLRREQADVLVTDRPGRFLSMRFADCVPVLLYDPRRRAVGLAHAGWRGTAAGAAGAAVRALTAAYGSRPGDVLAGIGPSIGPCCYDVGDEVAAQFDGRPGGVQRSPAGRAVLDLWSLNRDALTAAGVPREQIEVSGLCTRCHADEFFSHRAAGGGPSGRFAAVAGVA
jgi:YfiH family protein